MARAERNRPGGLEQGFVDHEGQWISVSQNLGLAVSEPLTLRVIGWNERHSASLAQVLALWPGTSRSLVTILAALVVGLDLAAAVEFSFLLGLLTLSAATAYDLVKHGSELFDTYGVVNPAIGFVVAFVSAVVAVQIGRAHV